MPETAAGWIAPPYWVVYIVIITIFTALFALAVAITRALRRSAQWSLAEALSEQASLTPGGTTGMVASSSRLIAFLGMIAILGLFLGFGVFVLWGVAITGHPPNDVDDFNKYLLGGVTLFAPYVVNKFASVFSVR